MRGDGVLPAVSLNEMILVLQDVSCGSYECKDHNRKGRFYWRISLSKESESVFLLTVLIIFLYFFVE